jgi:predicted nucleic acid-binding protein
LIYLLDTNIISGLMRADAAIEAWIAGLEVDARIVICTIVRGEILFGISRLDAGRRRSELEAVAERYLESIPCEAIPEAAADLYAGLKLSRQKSGMTLDENDLWIAATAIALGATLVSRDSDLAEVEELRTLRL